MEEKYIKQLEEQLHSFAEAMATAIDERTPYNGNHTRKVAEYVVKIAEKINEKYNDNETTIYFSDERIEKLKLAALVHDIGKMVVSKSIMNRSTRMCDDMQNILTRFKLFEVLFENDYLKGKITESQYHSNISELKAMITFIEEIDDVEHLSDEKYNKVQKLKNKKYIMEDGQEISYFNDEEIAHLSIRQGTLTEKEREIMQSHVVMTEKILDKVRFTEKYKDVPIWASRHHEFLDGSGYPNALTEEYLPVECRILTVADIYDALTAIDRPYKQPNRHEDAIDIMIKMADEGKIDKKIVMWLNEAIIQKD